MFLNIDIYTCAHTPSPNDLLLRIQYPKLTWFDMGKLLVSADYILIICTHRSYSNPEVFLENFGLALILRFLPRHLVGALEGSKQPKPVRVTGPTGHLKSRGDRRYLRA